MIRPFVLFSLQIYKLLIWIYLTPVLQDFYNISLSSFGTWIYHSPKGVIVAPYGIFWESFYLLISLSGYFMIGIYCLIIDSLFMIVISKFQSFRYSVLFSLSSMMFFLFSPGDLLPLWMAAIGKEKPFMSIIAVATKLPWPAPAWVWNFVLSTSLPENTGSYLIWRYLVLGIWILHPAFYWIRSRL